MKLLMYHLDHLELVDRKKSDRPKNIIVTNNKSKNVINDVLGIFICIEVADDISYVEEAVDEVKRQRPMAGKSGKVIIIPFVHLSKYIKKSKKSIEILEEFAKQLSKANFIVEKGSFGWHKDFIFSGFVPGHRGSIAYRTIPNNFDGDLMNILSIEDKEKVITKFIEIVGIEKIKEMMGE